VVTTDFEGIIMKKAKSFSPSNGNSYINFSEDNTDKFTLSKTSCRYFTEQEKFLKERRRLKYKRYFMDPNCYATKRKNIARWFQEVYTPAFKRPRRSKVPTAEEFKAIIEEYEANLPKQTVRFQNLSLQSNLIPTDDLSLGDFRLLTVTANLILPRGATIRFLVSSTDVLHS
jgi:heme/copper-type cytochrome/quinol oxidase subunit 2